MHVDALFGIRKQEGESALALFKRILNTYMQIPINSMPNESVCVELFIGIQEPDLVDWPKFSKPTTL